MYLKASRREPGVGVNVVDPTGADAFNATILFAISKICN